MLDFVWSINAEQRVSRRVERFPNPAVDYRDREFVEGPLEGELSAVVATLPDHFTHLTVNPLVSRPRAEHG